MQSLAVVYRPSNFSEVVGQENIKQILQQQLSTEEFKHAYLFCGGAGTGKTTCARIFANELNNGQGSPIELDAASNNGVDDVRSIIQQAKSKSMESEYKVFIIDECHSISNAGWQAFLKIIEEPPAKSIFIFCTTDPQKIPKTILSRVQRYDFQRISQDGIVNRLKLILEEENKKADDDALEYIAKIADGGMRDSITMLDKCISYNENVTLENVVKALGTVDYDVMIDLTNKVCGNNILGMVQIVEDIHTSGKDIKQFLKNYLQFLLDVNKYLVGCDWKYVGIPQLKEYKDWMNEVDENKVWKLLDVIVRLNSNIKYSQTPKYDIEAELMLFMGGEEC
jgi:DNA polymerase-3 subunit gamma/tau